MPYVWGAGCTFKETDVQILDREFGSMLGTAAAASGLFYTADGDVVWGAKNEFRNMLVSQNEGRFGGRYDEIDESLAFGEEMIVGYNLKHSIGDTIVDLARKNDRYGMLTGLEELLKPVLDLQMELSALEQVVYVYTHIYQVQR